MKNITEIKTDVLVIGAGIAGMESALEAQRAGLNTLIISKGAAASPAVLGFNAPISKEDSPNLYFNDTYLGGGGIGNPNLVNELVTGANSAIEHMEELGLKFDESSEKSGEYHLLKPLGCSLPRLAHSANLTGKRSMELLRNALVSAGAIFIEQAMATSLITANNGVVGALAISTKREEMYVIRAKAIVLATGGAHLLSGSTYPLCQTADGYAMAYRCGISLVDMEFEQFEPCRAIYPKPLGISTTLLAKGGILTNNENKRFVLENYENEGKVQKDALARLVAKEIKEGRGTEHGGVWLDLTNLDEKEIKENHKLYYDRFQAVGIDLCSQRVEVAPAAHSIMGGIKIDKDTWTGVKGLFAAGEVIGGLHGANRLGGNAGTETYVFGRIAGTNAAKTVLKNEFINIDDQTFSALSKKALGNFEICEEAAIFDYDNLKKEIQSCLAKGLGPIRSGDGLSETMAQIEKFRLLWEEASPTSFKDLQGKIETDNLLLVGTIVCRAALAREESRGVHFREDFPIKNDMKFKRQLSFNKERDLK